MSKIGELIGREIRLQRRTIKDVAERADISREALSNIVNGKQEPRRDTIDRIADALGVKAESLLELEGGVSMGRLDTNGQMEFNGHEVAAPPMARKPEDVSIIREAFTILDLERDTLQITEEEWSTCRDVIRKVLQAVEGKVK